MNKGLLKGSIILLISFNLFNFLNFIFNISMARLLTLAEYGVLTTLISLIIIFAIFSESIQTVLSKYTTKEKVRGKLKNLAKKAFRKAGTISIIILIIYLIIGLFIAQFLNISYSLISLTGIMLFISFFIPVTRGILQGRKQFSSLGINMVWEGLIKLVLSIGLVILGIGVLGALLGMIIGSAGAFLISLFSLRDIFITKEKKIKTPEIYTYTKPVFITTLAIVLFLSFDIILARRFFSPDIVGVYAIGSTIAKIIFIGTHPISKAMFPISSETKKPKDSLKVLKNSIAILVVLIALALVFIFFFADLIIWLFAGRYIPEAASILFYLAIAMSLLSLTNLILLYNLSLGILKSSWLLLVFIVIQVILLSVFNSNLIEFSFALITSAAAFLWGAIFLLKK
ncbi:MAG: oligosaccharide flippase family protein [Nanoarchaeota archaeon]|nr:oligosaccharide flippase family protein [Nanoarchaeota archaeon]